MTLLSRCSNASATRWVSSGLLPLPPSAAVGAMDSLVYHHCMLYWVKLSCEAMLQRDGVLLPLALDAARDTLRFVVQDICCVRLATAPRCLPTWRLLDQVLSELLLHQQKQKQVETCGDMDLTPEAGVVRRMLLYLRHYIIRYLETRDRPLEGQCGFLHYRGVFDRESGGVNGGGVASGERHDEEYGECDPALSAQDLCDALLRLCGGRDTTGGHSTGGECGSDGDDGSGGGAALVDVVALETFLYNYFLQSAPAAFDRLPKSQE
ncbi:hypothetical protein DQ04_00781030 [Trypanosoma grayi]|uniref:hypothetical protein n=1 Tax=Trypanosoma grayi TaxID=71804 RepID=UPI0004F42277|nr:hypothetical protein DQ04_00781030 [Trypanosoma grayi]KEG13792.1 hypothetical protein DQ04_00781030 [Trypanosoma grayi]